MRSGLAGRQLGGSRVCGAMAALAACVWRRPNSKRLGARARAERTRNMRPMFGTLAVLKWLSGWLNFPARCRVKGRVCDAVWAGREAAGCVGRWQR